MIFTVKFCQVVISDGYIDDLISKDKKETIEEQVASYKSCQDDKKKRIKLLKIVEQTLALVKKIALPIASQTSLPAEDLLQVGSLGLIKAIEFYEPDKNAKFETYANYFIKGEIRHYVRDKAGMIKAPRKVQELLLKIYSAQKNLIAEGNSDPTDEDIAKYLKISPEQVRDVMKIEQYKTLVSLDQSSSDDEDLSLLEKIPSDDLKNSLDLREDKIMLSSVIEKLSPELRKIILMSFYEDKSQREIAEALNISQMQVSRRLKKALSQMYNLIKQN